MHVKRFPLEEIEHRAKLALMAHHTHGDNAELVAQALVRAEADGQKGHGLSRLPSYCAQAWSGKVDGHAQPHARQVAEAAFCIDAGHGFAFPALALASECLSGLTGKTGVGVASVFHSHHCGVAGHHVEAMARQGFIGLFFANTPKAIAPWGGKDAVFGTNPLALGAPRPSGEDPVIIDVSLSKVARGKIMFADQEHQRIPDDWALDAEGQPTTDPRAALIGTMLPMGDAKGAALAFLVEIMAGALTGAQLSFQASSFFTGQGPPPGVGQCLIALSPSLLSRGHYESHLERLISRIEEQDNTRVPGQRRFQLRKLAREQGLALTRQQVDQLHSLSSPS